MASGTTTANGLYKPIALPLFLPSTNFPGPYNFNIDFEVNTDYITKATPWVYVVKDQKLFVKMMYFCPILFKITGDPPPGSGIRGILMYKSPEHYKEIVKRCPVHKDRRKDGPYPDHVMRCENPSTVYDSCPKTMRFSLFLPLCGANAVEGQEYFRELFKFTCFNSCPGGMDKRPTFLLFSLENGEKSYGRVVIEIRICASPGRDSTLTKEISTNQRKKKRNEPSTSDITSVPLPSTQSPGSSPTTPYPPQSSVLVFSKNHPSTPPEPFQFPTFQKRKASKPRKHKDRVSKDGCKRFKKTCTTEDELFTITIRGRERYEILQKFNEELHLLDGLKPPEQHSISNGIESSQTYTNTQPTEIRKEKPAISQYDVSLQSSQEHDLSLLSRTSSNANASSRSSNLPGYSITVFTMKRPISLKQ